MRAFLAFTADFYNNNFSRRSGQDRRKINIDVFPDRRSGQDQRDLVRHQSVLVEKLKNTVMFQRLSDSQFERIISIGSKLLLPRGDVLLCEGEETSDLYILFEGVLRVIHSGKEINLITPIAFAGELCTFTGEPVYGTYAAKSDCTLMRLKKGELSAAFDEDSDLREKLLEGLLIDMSLKIRTMSEIIVRIKSSRTQ